MFGDTSKNVDEVISPRFFFCLLTSIWTEETIHIQSNNSNNKIIMMRRFYALLPLLAILLIPTGAWADVWQDPETKVNYEYTPGQSEAGVKKGTGWDSNDQAGCPEASGDIAILSSFTIGGETYTVTEIRNYAFAHCNNLTSVKIPNTINFIGIGAFAECWSLHSINIPESVKYLCPCAFMRCALTSIDIPGSVESIGYQAFLQCSRLETVTIGEGVTTIRGTNVSDHLDGGAFSWCFNLKKVTLPESLKEIGTETFGGCNKLSAIELPKNLEKIGKKAFYGTGNECERFDVYSHIEEPFALNEVFDGNGKNPDENTLYVPAGTKAKYEATDGWKEFKNIVEMAMLDLITGETTVNTEGLGNENLSDNVVNDVYYNVGSEGYDASDKSVVISQTTNMGQITDATPGSSEVKNNFNGLILKVAAGKGTITVNVKTTGNAQLVVQVGNGTPMIASKTEQGDVVVSYDVAEDTYVYIYAIIGSSAAPAHRAAPADAVKIYSIKVTPGATGIDTVHSTQSTVHSCYTLDGRMLQGQPTKKGVYIVNGKKIVIR